MQAQTVQRADARRNRGLILEAAKAAFARDGIDASLDEVARSAGVGPGTLYRHFPTREHLLCELLHERQTVLLSNRDKAAALSCATTRIIRDRKSTRLNSSHVAISYAVFCLKKK